MVSTLSADALKGPYVVAIYRTSVAYKVRLVKGAMSRSFTCAPEL